MKKDRDHLNDHIHLDKTKKGIQATTAALLHLSDCPTMLQLNCLPKKRSLGENILLHFYFSFFTSFWSQQQPGCWGHQVLPISSDSKAGAGNQGLTHHPSQEHQGSPSHQDGDRLRLCWDMGSHVHAAPSALGPVGQGCGELDSSPAMILLRQRLTAQRSDKGSWVMSCGGGSPRGVHARSVGAVGALRVPNHLSDHGWIDPIRLQVKG